MLKFISGLVKRNFFQMESHRCIGESLRQKEDQSQRLLMACWQVSQLREEIDAIQKRDDTEELTESLVFRHRHYSMLAVSLNAGSFEALKQKQLVLSDYLPFVSQPEQLRDILGSFFSDFDRFISHIHEASLSDPLNVRQQRLSAVEDTDQTKEAIFALSETFWTDVQLFRVFSQTILDEVRCGQEEAKILDCYSHLEYLLSAMALLAANTFKELVEKKRVLDFCLSTEIEFHNSVLLAASFMSDWERIIH